MKELKVNVYKTNEGLYALNDIEEDVLPCVRDYLRSTRPEMRERSSRALGKRARSVDTQTEEYKKWEADNTRHVHSVLDGTAHIEYDGRLQEGDIKDGIVRALSELLPPKCGGFPG